MIDSQNIRAYVERMASDEPAPGGGAAAALQLALGAALVGMSARYTTAPEHADDARRAAGRAEELIPAALRLADADADAFGALSAAYALPKASDREQSERSRAIQEATVGAARPPRDLVGVGAEVFELTRELETWVNPNVLSDVAAAAEATRAAIATAVVTIEINLASLKDPATRDELSADVERAEELAEGTARLARRIRERIRA
ncbi:cyclodeaminase/cyclohydrolase family protein [Kocuria sp. cx-455]|uniref:cyclodeaminase/cyclohydrolase family protein n=1 Tax=Kocuria sp. cx-455 TaxID=2771377 RepID=UPI003D7052EC